MQTCPQDDVLHGFLRGELADESSGDLQEHLNDCVGCQAKAEQWVDEIASPATPPSIHDATTELDLTEQHRRRIAEQIRRHVEDVRHDDFSPPTRLGDYQLLDVLGEGGMGTVYRARQTSLNRIVAVKVVSSGRFGKRSLVERFFYEAESAAKLNHPGIVPIYDVGEASGQVYYAMAYIPGGSLSQALMQKPYASVAAAKCLRGIALAIQFAHDHGVIHRDLKPANILLDEDGQPKVADFGLAKQIDSAASLTVTGEVLGTPSYMPPEQARVTEAEISATGDIYSLGAILFHLLTGRPPFVAVEPVDVLHQLIHDDPIRPRQLNPSIHRDLETIALKCLAKQPVHRYQSAAELIDELDRFLDHRPISARPMGPLGRSWRWCKRNPAVAGLSATVLSILLISTVVSGYFGLLAQHRANELQSANDDLIRAKDDAKRSAEDATKQASLALQQADTAMRTLELMLFDMQAPFKSDPAAQEQRRVLLNTVLNELSRMPANTINESRLKRCRATAYLGLADVEMQAGNSSGLAGPTGSMENYERAIALFEELLDADPDNDDYVHDLAEANWECGETYVVSHQFAQARTYFDSALKLGQRMLQAHPDDLSVQCEMANYEVSVGEIHTFMREHDAAFKLLRSALDRSRKLVELQPRDRAARDVFSTVNKRIGDLYVLVGDHTKARESFEAFRDTAADLALQFPLDYDLQMEHSTAYERLGDCSFRQGNKSQGCAEYEESLRLCVDLGTSAPNNDQIQWDVTFSYQKLADGYLQLGDLEKARINALRCVEMRRKLVQTGPTIPLRRVKLNHALKSLARAYQRSGDIESATHCYQEAIEVARSFDELNGTHRFVNEIKSLEKLLSDLSASKGTLSASTP